MTADLWNTTDDPFVLLDYKFPLTGADSVLAQTRKSKLYYVACADRIPDALPWFIRRLIDFGRELAESPHAYTAEFRNGLRTLAEDTANNFDIEIAAEEAEGWLAERGVHPPPGARTPLPPGMPWLGLAYLAFAPLSKMMPHFRYVPPALHSVACARDIFEPVGVQRVSFAPEWRSSPVLALAERMYRENEFAAMPILHDALMDAGCAADLMLEHCETPHGHVRGCWVVDMILRKPG